jgi:hypothetical protein
VAAADFIHSTEEPRRVLRLDDARGVAALYACDLERLMEVPHLSVGDVLVLRGDVPHRTEDVMTERLVPSPPHHPVPPALPPHHPVLPRGR